MPSASFLVPPNSRVIINQIDAPKKTEQEQQQAQDLESYEDDKKGNHNLPQELQTGFLTLLRHYGTEVDKHARRLEVIEARRQRFYDRLYQYIYFNWGSMVFLPITAGVVMSAGSDSVMMPRYTAVYDIYSARRRNFQAVLSQNPPAVAFEPADPTASLDIKIAQASEKYAEHYDTVNEIKRLQTKMGRLMWTDGRIVAVTWHEKNAQKFGTFKDQQDQEDQRDYQEDVPQAQEAATVEGEEEAGEEPDSSSSAQPDLSARGEEVTRLYGVLEAKVFPVSAEDQDGVEALVVSTDPPVNTAKEKYSWIASQIKAGSSGTGESAFERNARLGINQGTRQWMQASDSYAHLAERHWLWMRPAAYRKLDVAQRKVFKRIFPQGVRVTFIGEVYAESYSVSMDDQVVIDHAKDGDGMHRPSWGKGMMSIQDALNNYRNYRQEIHDYGAPWTAYDRALFDGQAMRERISQPGEMFGVVNPDPSKPIAQYFHQPLALQPPGDMIQAEADLRGPWAELEDGMQPSMFGGNLSGGKEADTVGAYAMSREQAMGIAGMPFGVMESIFAKCKRQAVLAAAANRRAEDSLTVVKKLRGGRKKKMSVSIGDLQKGNFRAVAASDSNYPATRGQKKQALTEFFALGAENPVAMEATLQPDNLQLAAELEGLNDVDIPARGAWIRQMDEIDQLLETGPIPPTYQQAQQALLAATAAAAVKASAQGQQAPPLPQEMALPPEPLWKEFIQSGAWLDHPIARSLAKCSVDVDEDDFHQYHLQAIKNWKNSDQRDKEIETGNRAGLVNLDLHRDLHKKFAAQEAAAQQPQAKPPSESMNFKDLPPAGQVQMASKVGIQLGPQDVMPPPMVQQPGVQAGAGG